MSDTQEFLQGGETERLTPLNVGVLPSDWSAGFMDEICSSTNNGFVGKSLPHQVPNGDGVTYIQGFNVRENRIDLTNCANVTREFAEKQTKAKLLEGDLLTVQSGHIGTVAVVPSHLDGASCHALIISRPDRTRVCPHYVAYYLNSTRGQRRLRGLHVGSTIKHINTSELARFRIALPPLPEQKKIASILSTCDGAIEKTGALIDAKKRQKKALMQQLLTGKKRLPGFEGEWETCKFSELFERVTRKNKDGCQNNLTISGPLGLINQEEYFKKRIAAKDVSGYYLLKRGEFAYNKSYCKGYPLGAIKMLTRYDEGVVSTLYICFRLRDGAADSEFMRHYFESPVFNHELYKVAQEGARNHGLLNVAPDDFFNTHLEIPEKEEQIAISRVLGIADDELQALQSKLTALKQQKKALMQKLLTGQVRVI